MNVTNEELLREINKLTIAVECNTKDIIDLKNIVQQGRGAFKVLALVGSVVVVFLSWFKL